MRYFPVVPGGNAGWNASAADARFPDIRSRWAFYRY